MIRALFFSFLTIPLSSFSQSNFDKNEIQHIHPLVEYVESSIGINQSDIYNSYLSYFQEESLNYDTVIFHVFTKTELRKTINSIPETLRNEIWSSGKATAFRAYDNTKFEKPIEYEYFGVNTSGKYLTYLKEVSKENNDDVLSLYIEEITKSGMIPTLFVFRSLIINYKDRKSVDFNSDYWRMIIAIQYITMIENTYRHIELSEN
jgi:hypothetical protein